MLDRTYSVKFSQFPIQRKNITYVKLFIDALKSKGASMQALGDRDRGYRAKGQGSADWRVTGVRGIQASATGGHARRREEAVAVRRGLFRHAGVVGP
ncbi:hypothetical protein [Mesorhizobium loti]|uniref:hypothetical protein n=1 Tax=Rhizobium loti TaxID=381 RepID=UPI0011B4C9B0|nr:hypothetical protein [Mesorhizobium loti]